MEESAYDIWHRQHAGDSALSSSWYQFAGKHLLSEGIANKVILEVGCGRGEFSHFVAQSTPPPQMVYACDYSDSALAIAKQDSPRQNITWQKEDIQKLSFPDYLFDAVVSCETIEHVPNPKIAIKELYRTLKPGGKLILTCPNYFNPFGLWCIYRWMIGKPYTEGGQPYVNYVLMPLVRYWLSSAGFSVEICESAAFIIPARIPRRFFNEKTPWWLKYFGLQTYYVARKPVEVE